MKSIFLIAAVAAIASTGAYALRSGDSGAATPGNLVVLAVARTPPQPP
ncbi:hypothetical protein [Aeoliella sp.]